MSVRELVAEYGSPLWLADVERFRSNLRRFAAAWQREWPNTRIAYSYKTNRLLAFLQAIELGGADAEVVCESEYLLAAGMIEVDPARIIVDGPAKPDSLLARAAAGGALVLADSRAELERAANHGVRRVGLRVALDSFTGACTRFGIPTAEIPDAANAAAGLGLTVEALSTHLVSTDFEPASRRIVVSWPRSADDHVSAAALLAGLACDLRAGGRAGMHPVSTIDLGGGLPAAPAVAGHARAVAGALRARGFAGTLLLEPGRAIVADAVDLAFTVIAVKTLADGRRCLACDAGINLLPGAVSGPPQIEALEREGALSEALVTGPLCLNTDVLHPQAQLPTLESGSLLIARAVGAYQQVASTQFGEPRPAVVVYERDEWRLHTPAEAQRALSAVSARVFSERGAT